MSDKAFSWSIYFVQVLRQLMSSEQAKNIQIRYWYSMTESSNLPILNPQPSTIHFEFPILCSPALYLKSPLADFNSLPSTLLPTFSVKSAGYLIQMSSKQQNFRQNVSKRCLQLFQGFDGCKQEISGFTNNAYFCLTA